MTLTWDSGTEAVGTVSVVYTGMNGGGSVLMQKTIGKAGGNGGDGSQLAHSILHNHIFFSSSHNPLHLIQPQILFTTSFRYQDFSLGENIK